MKCTPCNKEQGSIVYLYMAIVGVLVAVYQFVIAPMLLQAGI